MHAPRVADVLRLVHIAVIIQLQRSADQLGFCDWNRVWPLCMRSNHLWYNWV